MIELFSKKIEIPSIEFIRISWKIEPTTEKISDYFFSIFRSNAPEGPYSIIKEKLQDTFNFDDFGVNNYSDYRIFYYIIRITSPDGKIKSDSAPFRIQVEPDPISLEMIRKKNVALNFGSSAGLNVDVFIRKTWGTYCSCFDNIKKRKTIANCPICFGTNYEGGYFSPVRSRSFWGTASKFIEKLGWEDHPNRTVIEMSNYPLLSPGDVVKHVDLNKNYRIKRIDVTRRRTYIISQFAQIEDVDNNDIESQLI